MPEREDLTPAERELETAFKSLAPAAARVDTVGAAFEAGRQSVRTQLLAWRFAAAAAMFIGVGSWLVPTAAEFGTQIPIAATSTAPVAQPLSVQSLLMLQTAYRDKGLAGLPATDLPPVEAVRSADLL